MALTNAEKQARHRQREQARIAELEARIAELEARLEAQQILIDGASSQDTIDAHAHPRIRIMPQTPPKSANTTTKIKILTMPLQEYPTVKVEKGRLKPKSNPLP